MICHLFTPGTFVDERRIHIEGVASRAMALTSTRMDFRIELSHVDRAREASERVLVARHPSESIDHVILRVLAYCLFHEEGLELGPALSDAEGSDLWTRDPTGRVTTWIECGAAPLEKLKKVVQHHAGVRVHALFSDARKRDELLETARDPAARAAKVADSITVWTVGPELVSALAQREARSSRWAVTIVGENLYIDVDGTTLEGEVAARPLLDAV